MAKTLVKPLVVKEERKRRYVCVDLGYEVHDALRKAKNEKHMTFQALGKAYIEWCLKHEGYL